MAETNETASPLTATVPKSSKPNSRRDKSKRAAERVNSENVPSPQQVTSSSSNKPARTKKTRERAPSYPEPPSEIEIDLPEIEMDEPTTTSAEDPVPKMTDNAPQERDGDGDVQLKSVDVPKMTDTSSSSAGNAIDRRVVARWMAKHRETLDAEGIFSVMASVTVDEVEACYPSVSIVSGAVKAGSLITPSADNLRGEIEKDEFEEGEVPEGKPTPEQLRDAMLAGAFIGSGEVVDDCLRKGADLSLPESSGRNVLHYLATGGHGALCTKVLKRLEKEYLEKEGHFQAVVNQKDSNGWTPLLVAVCRSQLEVVESLLSYPEVDCDITLLHSCPPSQGQDKSESSAIHFAAIQGSAQIAKRLMERGVRINAVDSLDRNIFHYIAAHKNQTLAGAFFASITGDPRFSPSFLLSRDSHQRDPLYIAVCYGSTDLAVSMIRLLSTASKNGQLEASQGWCLKSALLSPDSMSLSCVQVAHLRRNYEIIYKLGKVWPLYHLAEHGDPESFVEALTNNSQTDNSQQTRPSSPSLIITQTLSNPQLWTTWLRTDLSNAERVTVDLVKRTIKFMGNQKGHNTNALDARQESQLMRSVRRCGTELVLKALDALLAAEMEHVHTSSTFKRSTELISFFNSLKATVFASMSQREAQATWKYINAEGALASKTARNNPANSPTISSPSFAAPTATTKRSALTGTRIMAPDENSASRISRSNFPKPPVSSRPRPESVSPESLKRQGSSPLRTLPSFAAPTFSRLAASAKPPPKFGAGPAAAIAKKKNIIKSEPKPVPHSLEASSAESLDFCG